MTTRGHKLKDATFRDILFVAENMRSEDKREIYATRWTDDPYQLARDCIGSSAGFAWTMGKNCPIAAIGAFPMWQNVWSAWMFATDRFPEIGLSMTKFVKNQFIPTIKKSAHRAQCFSIEGHDAAHKWLESVGGKRESVIENYGKNREKFFLYTWEN